MKIRNVLSSFVAAALSLSSVSAFGAGYSGKLARPPQFILLSFDGSKSIPFWQETRAFSQKHNIGLTYFISGVYFLSGEDTQLYQPPNHRRGKSDIGFGKSHEDIKIRTDEVMGARNQNLEMGSHVNGHYDGSGWSFNDWMSELSQFKDFMKDVFSINRFRADYENEWKDKIVNEMKGIRAPLLGVNKDYYKALKESGYNYDTSGIGKTTRWPYRDQNGLWMFPLQVVRLAGTGKKTITMDYNVMVSQCNNQFSDESGTVCKDATPEKFKAYEEETYETYVNLFKENYFGNRAPLVIGHHFALWNNGAYWKALQRFAADVCNQEEVRCITYGEMIKWMEGQTSERKDSLASYEAAKFPMMPPKSLNIISQNTNSYQIEAEIEKEQNGSLVAKLRGQDAQLLKLQEYLDYEWKVDGKVRARSHGKPMALEITGYEPLDGKIVTLSVKKKDKEIIGAYKTIRKGGSSLWLQSNVWPDRILKGDLPEAHSEIIDEKLLRDSRVK